MTEEHSSKQRSTRRDVLRTAVACAVVTISTLSATLPAEAATAVAPATHSARLSLPLPTGRYKAGEVPVHLVDHSRPDPWQTGQHHRELMVSVYYPTTHTARHPVAPYMLPKAAAHFDAVTANDCLGMNLPTGQVDWAAVATHAVQAAPVARGDGKRPVLIHSPGLGEPRTWGTTLVMDLASRGYVVVTIDNTYESPEVEFPDGSLATMVTPTEPDAFIRKSLAVRTTDTSFVLDQLGLAERRPQP